jgi:hypothetical protein
VSTDHRRRIIASNAQTVLMARETNRSRSTPRGFFHIGREKPADHRGSNRPRLVDDHDPKRLHGQFEAEHESSFTWEYLEQGPEVWRIRIGRPA